MRPQAEPAAAQRVDGGSLMSSSRGRRALATLRDPSLALGVAILIGLAGFSIVVPIFAPDPNAIDETLRRDGFGAPPGPSRAHWLGTDALFRDVLSRLAHGGRLSLSVAAAGTAIATSVGAALGIAAGLCAGTRARALDALVLRVVELLLALPFLLTVAAIGALAGRADVGTMLLVLGLTGWAGLARVVRGATLALRRESFVLAAKALGGTTLSVARRHLWPNLSRPVVVFATSAVAQMVLAEAVLSYLTVGVQPPRASWGRMLHEAEPFLSTRPSLVALPALAIVLTAIGFSRVADGLARAAPAGRSSASAQVRAGGRALGRSRAPLDLALAGSLVLLAFVTSPRGLAAPGASSDNAAPAPRHGGTLRLATAYPIKAADPAIAYDEGASTLSSHVFARLVAFDEQGRLVPELAESFAVDAGGRAITFTLREAARLHDGSVLDATRVVRSLERTLHPKTPCPAASLYGKIDGFADYQAGKADRLRGLRVTGPRSLRIELSEPDATMLPLLTLAFAAPVCASMGDLADPARPAAPCGAGPFRWKAVASDGTVVLERHEGYFDAPKPYLDAIELTPGVRASTQRYRLERGELDHVRELSSSDAARFAADSRWATTSRWVPRKSVHGVFMNTEMPPFNDRAFRRAVSFALDPRQLERVRPDLAATDRMIPPGVARPSHEHPLRVVDQGRALAEMARAGYPFDPETGRGGYPERIEILAVPDSFDQAAAEIYQAQLARIGVRLDLRLVSFATYLAEVSSRRAARMGVAGWSADYPDPATFFDPVLSSETIRDRGSQNYAFFANAELDALLDRARVEPDRDARLALFGRAEEIVAAEAPWVPLYTQRILEVWQPRLRGYVPHPIIAARFTDAWLDAPLRSPSLEAPIP